MNLNRLELRYFRLVVAIAETGSITKAADRLFLTQSALSHQLKEVESLLETDLFHRVNKKLVLTESGKIFLEHSYSVLGEVQKLTNDLQKTSIGETGKIRLMLEGSTGYQWLPRILKRFQLEFPNVDVRLSSTPSNKPIDQLLSGKIDVAILHRIRSEKNIEFKEILSDEVVALVPSNHELANKKYLQPEDFKNITYITHSKHFDESAFSEGFLKPNGVMPKKVMYIQHTDALVGMVREGLGIAVLGKWLAEPYVDADRIKTIRVTPKGLNRKWYIASLKVDQRTKYLDRFIELVIQTIADTPR